jgi:hypothetical protein
MTLKPLHKLIQSWIDRISLGIHERTAINETWIDRRRRYVVKIGWCKYMTVGSSDLFKLNRVLKKNYTIYDLLMIATTIVEWDPIKGNVIKFGKRELVDKANNDSK